MEAIDPSNSKKERKIMSVRSRASPPILCNTESSASSKNSTDEWSSSSEGEGGAETDGESDHTSVNDSVQERAADGAGIATKRGNRETPQQPSSHRREEGKKARKGGVTCRKSIAGRNCFAHVEDEDSDVNDTEPTELLINDLQNTVARLVSHVETIQVENLEMMNRVLQLAASNVQLLATGGECTSPPCWSPDVATTRVAPCALSTPTVPSNQPSTDDRGIGGLHHNECLTGYDDRRDNDVKTPSLAQDAAHPHLQELIAQYSKSDHTL
jgi:hypothetical protein